MKKIETKKNKNKKIQNNWKNRNGKRIIDKIPKKWRKNLKNWNRKNPEKLKKAGKMGKITGKLEKTEF